MTARWMRTALAAAVVLAGLPPAVCAQSYPAGPVRIIVPFPAGGATDVLGRVLSIHCRRGGARRSWSNTGPARPDCSGRGRWQARRPTGRRC